MATSTGFPDDDAADPADTVSGVLLLFGADAAEGQPLPNPFEDAIAAVSAAVGPVDHDRLIAGEPAPPAPTVDPEPVAAGAASTAVDTEFLFGQSGSDLDGPPAGPPPPAAVSDADDGDVLMFGSDAALLPTPEPQPPPPGVGAVSPSTFDVAWSLDGEEVPLDDLDIDRSEPVAVLRAGWTTGAGPGDA